MTNLQQALEKKHGTPVEFEKALLIAVNRGVITLDEMINGAIKYRDEWATAGKVGDFTKVKLQRAGFTKDQSAIILALFDKPGDTLASATERARNLMDLQAGCGLSDTSVANIYRDLILKLIGHK